MKKFIGLVAHNKVEVLNRLYNKKVGSLISENENFYRKLFHINKEEVFMFHFSENIKTETNRHLQYIDDLIIETITTKNTIEKIIILNGKQLSEIYYEDVYAILKSMPNSKSFCGNIYITIEH